MNVRRLIWFMLALLALSLGGCGHFDGHRLFTVQGGLRGPQAQHSDPDSDLQRKIPLMEVLPPPDDPRPYRTWANQAPAPNAAPKSPAFLEGTIEPVDDSAPPATSIAPEDGVELIDRFVPKLLQGLAMYLGISYPPLLAAYFLIKFLWRRWKRKKNPPPATAETVRTQNRFVPVPGPDLEAEAFKEAIRREADVNKDSLPVLQRLQHVAGQILAGWRISGTARGATDRGESARTRPGIWSDPD